MIAAVAMVICGILIVIVALCVRVDECPRVILGYNCRKGNPNFPEGCNHSRDSVESARLARSLNH